MHCISSFCGGLVKKFLLFQQCFVGGWGGVEVGVQGHSKGYSAICARQKMLYNSDGQCLVLRGPHGDEAQT